MVELLLITAVERSTCETTNGKKKIILRVDLLNAHNPITVSKQVSLHPNLFLKFVKIILTVEGRITNLLVIGCQDLIKVQFQILCFIFYIFHHYVEGLPPINGPRGIHGNQFQPSTFQPQMGLGGPPGPHMSEIDAYIHQMGQQMRPDLGRSAFPPRSMTLAPGNYVPANSSSSRNLDSMYTDMAHLSLNDSQHQIPTHLSPTSDHQAGLNPTDQMGSSAYPSTSYLRSPHYSTVQQGSQINPTSVPYMNESRSDMVNRHGLTVPTDTRPYRNNSSRPSSLASESTSSFISPPSIRVDPNSDRTREDRSVHRTNIDSFNESNDTVRDSYNDNSLVDTTGRYYGHGNVLFYNSYR